MAAQNFPNVTVSDLNYYNDAITNDKMYAI